MNEFRWRITDPANPRWSRWHALDRDCPGCCCGGPVVCPDCGGREHLEGAEARTVLDTAHDVVCQGCREDVCGDVVGIEERAAGEGGDAMSALVEQAPRVTRADETAGWERIRRDADVIAAHLTEMLPADMRAAGMRFEWAEEER